MSKRKKELVKQNSAYTHARAEMNDILSTQSTVKVARLRRIFQSMNLSFKPDTPGDSAEVLFLKSEIRKRNKTIEKQAEKIKRLKAGDNTL